MTSFLEALNDSLIIETGEPIGKLELLDALASIGADAVKGNDVYTTELAEYLCDNILETYEGSYKDAECLVDVALAISGCVLTPTIGASSAAYFDELSGCA